MSLTCTFVLSKHTHTHSYFACCVGHSKQVFCNRFNDELGKNLELNVRKSMTTPRYDYCVSPLFSTRPLKDREGKIVSAPMTLALTCRFARRTRNYERIYERFKTPSAMEQAAKKVGCSGFELMEKLYKICSVTSVCHRSTFDQERGLLRKVEQNDAGAFIEDAVHADREALHSVFRVQDVDVRVEKCFTMCVWCTVFNIIFVY